ncbi:MAG: hypothetical protein RLZZ436_4560 [Planctomycetota bacterium]|jgi:predicted RNA-binding protein with PIN domain
MAQLYLLIDGYNLLLSGSSGRVSFGAGGLQQARNRMLLSLRNWLDADAAANTCIVFDASSSGPAAIRQQTSSDLLPDLPFEVVFCTGQRDADDEIEWRLKNHSSPRQVLVVSSDHRLHRAAARRRACCMDSEHFLELLEKNSPQALRAAAVRRSSRKPAPQQPSTDKPPVLPDLVKQLADVYEEFQQIDVKSLEQPKRSRRSDRPQR